jgi:hypothetical protein
MAGERQQAGLLANMSPAQLANYGAAIGGQQLGRGLGSLFGAQDPQLQMITRRQQLLSQIDPSDPQALMRAAQQAGEMGDPQMALQLTDFANDQAVKLAQARERTATKSGQGIQEAARINQIETLLADLDPDSTEFKALTAEKQRLQRAVRAASGDKFSQLQELYAQRKEKVGFFGEDSQDVKIIDRLINSIAPEKSGDKGFESIAKAEKIGTLMDELETLKAENKQDTPTYRSKAAMLQSLIKTDKPNLSVVGEVRSGPDKGKTVYVDENKDQQFIYSADSTGKQVRKLVSDADVSRLTSQVTATASTSNIGEKTVVRGVAELDVEDLKTVRANKRAASASNDSLRNLLALDDRGLIGGAFATGRVGVGNLLNTLGVLSKKDSTELSNSQEYQKIGADLIFNALQGKLGTGVSNADRDFIKEIFPQLETSAAARRRLIKYLADKNNKQIDEANAAEDFLRKNKSFEGYKPLNSGVFHVPTTRLDLTGMTNAELKAAIDKKKSGGK